MSHSDEKLIAAVIKGMAQLEQVLRKNGAVGIGLKELLYSINRKLDTKIAKDIGKCIPIRNLVAHNATAYIDSDDVEYVLKKLTTVLSYFGEELKVKHSTVFWNNFEETARFYESMLNKHRKTSREIEELIYTRYLMPAIARHNFGLLMTKYSLSLNKYSLQRILSLLEQELKECKGVLSSVFWLIKLLRKDIEQFNDPAVGSIESFKYTAPESNLYNRYQIRSSFGHPDILSTPNNYVYSRPFHSNLIQIDYDNYDMKHLDYSAYERKLKIIRFEKEIELYKPVIVIANESYPTEENKNYSFEADEYYQPHEKYGWIEGVKIMGEYSEITTKEILQGWIQERKDFLALLEEHKRKFYKMPTFDPKDFSEEEVEFLIQKYQIPRRNIRTAK